VIDISYILIGVPSSGKTTIAKLISDQDNRYMVISTDRIRQQLYGDENIQGSWKEIEAEVFNQIEEHLSLGNTIIYDATNAYRPWRIELLQNLKQHSNINWIGLYIKTPLEICRQWNQQRTRQVLTEVIEKMYESLKNFPPIAAEGFTAVYPIPYTNGEHDIADILNKPKALSRNLINRANRTQSKKANFHQYSQLLDFDRLMHLISLIIRYPGIGNLHTTNPSHEILGNFTEFETSVDEIVAILTKKTSSIYADKQAIATDLNWLEKNGLIGECENLCELELISSSIPDLVTHTYSESEPFERLIKLIRFIIHHPFAHELNEGVLNSLINQMQSQQIINFNCRDSIRKDIEKVLKPYQILPNFSMKHGYFIGTAILPKAELVHVFRLLEAQSKILDDPVAFSTYKTFQNNLAQAKITLSEAYPVRAIHNRTIFDLEALPAHSLAHRISEVETAIEQGKLLELNRLKGGGRFTNEPDREFQVFPLQLVFHNIGWYLGFENTKGESKGLLQFERIDRLFLGRNLGETRDRPAQEKSLKNLKRLYESSGGIYLGNSYQSQHQYLSSDKSKKAKVEITIELWFSDRIFKFISEGNRRFPVSQMKMSPRLDKVSRDKKAPFTLAQSKDRTFPNRFQVTLPNWCIEDIDLLRWIVGFGGQVKVIEPSELINKVKSIGEAIAQIYQP
jgi:predicted kinase